MKLSGKTTQALAAFAGDATRPQCEKSRDQCVWVWLVSLYFLLTSVALLSPFFSLYCNSYYQLAHGLYSRYDLCVHFSLDISSSLLACDGGGNRTRTCVRVAFACVFDVVVVLAFAVIGGTRLRLLRHHRLRVRIHNDALQFVPMLRIIFVVVAAVVAVALAAVVVVAVVAAAAAWWL